ncbi:MAG: DUF2510 domain-containing protein [Candidatus Nanopelagicales bacterium]
MEGPAPGWYRDPTVPTAQRYWDGVQWTDYVAGGPLPSNVRAPMNGATKVAGALLIVGFVVGMGGYLLPFAIATASGRSSGFAMAVTGAAIEVVALITAVYGLHKAKAAGEHSATASTVVLVLSASALVVLVGDLALWPVVFPV